MNNWVYLSYPLDAGTPAYGGAESITIEHNKDMNNGDSCNTSKWCFSSHLGTHVDLPKHFSRDGKGVTDFPANYWIFNTPFLIDISPVRLGTLVQPSDIDLESVSPDTDLLIIKTGFCDYRSEEIYWKQNPGFSPQFAQILRKKFPNLRVFGFDSISVSSFMHRDIGREAHRAFLDDTRPIFLLEDMDLDQIGTHTELKKVIVSPLLVHGADGAPCTVLGKIF